MFDLSFSEAAFALLGTEYEPRKKLAEQLVVEWKWASSHVFEPTPLCLERNGYVPGRMLRQKPSDTNDCVEYGFDQERRIVVERQYTEFVGFYETFRRWSDTLIESAHYDYMTDKKPLNIELVVLENGKAICSVCSTLNGCSIENYEWTGSDLLTVIQTHAEQDVRITIPMHLTFRISGNQYL